MGKDRDRTQKVYCMQVVNDHQREQAVSAWRGKK